MTVCCELPERKYRQVSEVSRLERCPTNESPATCWHSVEALGTPGPTKLDPFEKIAGSEGIEEIKVILLCRNRSFHSIITLFVELLPLFSTLNSPPKFQRRRSNCFCKIPNSLRLG